MKYFYSVIQERFKSHEINVSKNKLIRIVNNKSKREANFCEYFLEYLNLKENRSDY